MTEVLKAELVETVKTNVINEPYRKYTADEVVSALEHAKGMIAPAARSLGCSRNTIKRYLKEDTDIARAHADMSEHVTDRAELKLFDAIERGEAWAICFYLKCKAKDRGYVERAEVSGPGGQPVKIKLVYDE
jgi:predicted transcriptional regulator